MTNNSPVIEGTSAVATPALYVKPTPAQDTYVRDYVRRAFTGVPLESPDPARANGSREALLSLYTVVKSGGNIQEAWERCVLNRPDLEIYTPRKPRWTALDFNELITLPPLEFLVPGMIIAGGLNIMFGASGVGKSFVALGVAENLSQDMPVLYVAGEGANGYRLRLEALQIRNERPVGRIRVIPGAVNLLDRREVEDFIEDMIGVYKPRLVIFDTLARCMVGGDENSSRDIGIVIDNCMLIQKTGAAVLIIHHTGKNASSGERGSSALRGAADSMIEVYKDDDLITVESSKIKDGTPFPTYRVKLQPYGESVAAIPAGRVPQKQSDKLTPVQYNILEVLAMEIFYDSGCRAVTLMENITQTLNRRTFYRTVNRLVELGFARKAGKYDPYCITETGLEALRSQLYR